ncbi:hypothetical protein JQS43_16125 [Natronosporangium hydrolyticum]|uniref:Uncharacterized protein n=1 Tax=Natronosporangium hydrolyticum TaxID=2811111 RepID=A0A895YG43_9ACTN|nr:hypothetical protein [Natronosporangium hydrolyticum]QSB13160.1 hypothetical protein JQS43_16125 [Natronosporangium hydrolyticum]
MASFRLMRQTNRSSRYAHVTVEVATADQTGVNVAAVVGNELRHEAELGAWWALRSQPATVVTVTKVVVTEADTSVGDVYEATARAVWKSLLVEHQRRYVGFSDPRMVTEWLRNMVGRRLDQVTEARHWHAGQRGPDAESLLHAWLFFDHAVPIGVHGRGDQFLLAKEDPYGSYDMGPHGQAEVGPAQHPDVLSRFVDARLADGAVIVGHQGECSSGLVLRFDTGDLTIGTLGDEWLLAPGAPPAALTRHSTVGPFVRGGHR